MNFPLPADFERTWRRQPRLLRGLVSSDPLCSPDVVSCYASWCRQPARARLFAPVQQSSRPIRSFDAGVPENAYRVFSDYASDGDVLTLLVNGVERTVPEIVRLRERFALGRDWRFDDVVATLSTVGSGIGYHAGHEDGFIVQLHGRRRWELWRPELRLSHYYRQLYHDAWVRECPPLPEPPGPPNFVAELSAGDALYTPPMWGHRGTTLELSVSLSVAWRGASIIRALQTVVGPDRLRESIAAIARNRGSVYRYVTDPVTTPQGVADAIIQDVAAAAQVIGVALDRGRLAEYARGLAFRVQPTVLNTAEAVA